MVHSLGFFPVRSRLHPTSPSLSRNTPIRDKPSRTPFVSRFLPVCPATIRSATLDPGRSPFGPSPDDTRPPGPPVPRGTDPSRPDWGQLLKSSRAAWQSPIDRTGRFPEDTSESPPGPCGSYPLRFRHRPSPKGSRETGNLEKSRGRSSSRPCSRPEATVGPRFVGSRSPIIHRRSSRGKFKAPRSDPGADAMRIHSVSQVESAAGAANP